jgi:hypothetical protein
MRGLFSRRPMHARHAVLLLEAQFYPADMGASPAEYLPGDFLLTRGTSWVSTLIRWGQALRFGINSPYAYWSHAALLVSTAGELIEATAKGITVGHIDQYRAQPYTLVRVNTTMSREDREQAVTFARASVGWEYGYFNFIAIALSCLTGSKFSFGREAEEVCSGFVARALERGSILWPRDPRNMAPGDLAKFFEVLPP